MEDLSLHILDIVENSIHANAKKIIIKVDEDIKNDKLIIEIVDDGEGMDKKEVKEALDPFYTTKDKKVGLGLSLLKQSVDEAEGNLYITTEKGKGMVVRAEFKYSHIDRKPIGDLDETVNVLILTHPEIRFEFIHTKDGKEIKRINL